MFLPDLENFTAKKMISPQKVHKNNSISPKDSPLKLKSLQSTLPNSQNSANISTTQEENESFVEPDKKKRDSQILYDMYTLTSLVLPSIQSKIRNKINKNKKSTGSSNIRLTNIEHIGSGSFSQVFKMNICECDLSSNSASCSDQQKKISPRFLQSVAIKIITTQSSPIRMLREIEIIKLAMEDSKIENCDNNIIPFITHFTGCGVSFLNNLF